MATQQQIREGFIKVQGGKDYKLAAHRVKDFREKFPLTSGWGIITELIEGGQAAEFATAEASIVNPEGKIVAKDRKTETKTDFPAGWVEKATTGAVARALALCGFGTLEIDIEGETKRPADSPLNVSNLKFGEQKTVSIDELGNHPLVKPLQPAEKLRVFKSILPKFAGKPDDISYVFMELTTRATKVAEFDGLLGDFEGSITDRKELLETLLNGTINLEAEITVSEWEKIIKEYRDNDPFKNE